MMKSTHEKEKKLTSLHLRVKMRACLKYEVCFIRMS